MTNDSEPTQPNSEPTTASSDDRDLQWNDTIDDWDAVLEGEPGSTTPSSSDSEPTERKADSSTTSQTRPTWATSTDRSGRSPPTQQPADDASHPSTSSDSSDGSSAGESDDTSTSTSSSDGTESSASDSDSTPSDQRRADGAGTVSSTAADDGAEFVRIAPISDPLLKTTAQVLPEAWLADTEVQQLIQWVVYSFTEETDPETSTGARAQVAFDRAAARTNANAAMIRQLCTTSLYRGQSGTPAENFHADLETIQRRLAAEPVASSD